MTFIVFFGLIIDLRNVFAKILPISNRIQHYLFKHERKYANGLLEAIAVQISDDSLASLEAKS